MAGLRAARVRKTERKRVAGPLGNGGRERDRENWWTNRASKYNKREHNRGGRWF